DTGVSAADKKKLTADPPKGEKTNVVDVKDTKASAQPPKTQTQASGRKVEANQKVETVPKSKESYETVTKPPTDPKQIVTEAQKKAPKAPEKAAANKAADVNEYNNKEYYSHNKYSYYDLENKIHSYGNRVEQPDGSRR
ncbi:hypothetical protein SARC_13345, partial [Sphaeroforma arctica JP610]